MNVGRGPDPKSKATYRSACDLVEEILAGGGREAILDRAWGSGSIGDALRRLRNSMRTHTFESTSGRYRLEGLVRRLDDRTREEGFHVLHEWDGKRFLDETIPVMMVDYYVRANKAVRPDRRTLAILLDYYFLYLLALLVMRIWDEGDPDENLEAVTRMLGHLQGEGGSGLQLVQDAATVFWIAISHYEPDDYAYHRLLDRVRTLGSTHQTRIALVGAAVLGDHLRWGFPVYYERDLGLMRADNVSDYPWLFYSVYVLMKGYDAMMQQGSGRTPEQERQRDDLVEAMLNGLTPDARAFTEPPPATLEGFREEHAEMRELLGRYKAELLRDFERHRPDAGGFTPLGFQYNFPHNVLIPMVTLALTQGMDPRLNMPLDALLTRRVDPGAPERQPEVLARTLMAYAGYSPETRGGRRTLMIIYDPNAALISFNLTLSVLKEPRPGERPASAQPLPAG